MANIFGAVRRNHALEHATVAVLLMRMGMSLRVVGRAAADGFYLYGSLDTEQVRDAAREALARLQSGERHLAVSPLCGTNLAVTGILTGLASLLTMGGAGSQGRWRRLPDVLTAAMMAAIAAQPLGRLVQRYLTTAADVADMRILEVVAGRQGPVRYHKVRTSQARR